MGTSTATLRNVTLHGDTTDQTINNQTAISATVILNIGNTVVDAITEFGPGNSIINDLGGNHITVDDDDPQLGLLTDNGGPTPTMLPLPGSPLIDAGEIAVVIGYDTDQRGFPRVSGANVDIGAVEIQAFVICYSGQSKIRTRNKITGVIADLCAKDVYSNVHEVYDVQKKEFVPVKYNVVTGPTNRYMLIKKDTFGENEPSEDFYITSGHKIVVNGVPTKARHIPEAKRVKVKPEAVYSICTRYATTIMVNGLEVVTWKADKWLAHSKKNNIDWSNNQPKQIAAQISC